MALPDNSIFREEAIEQYMQRREMHVILRLVSPRVLVFVWIFLFLSIAAGMLIWSIPEPIIVQGKGAVVELKATKTNTAQQIVILMLFDPSEQTKLKVGEPVDITIPDSEITFTTTIHTLNTTEMSPATINTLTSSPLPLGQLLSGPAIVATALVEPEAQAQTYLGSQCQINVQVGTQSALSLLPGLGSIPPIL